MHELVPEFEVMAADIDEKAIRHADPETLTSMLAKAKSEALRRRIAASPELAEGAVLVTSDQVVVCGGVIREKPVDAPEARHFLASYRTLPAICVTAVMAHNTVTGREATGVDLASVWFKNLTDEAIDSVIADNYIFSCAGGFAAGHPSFDQYLERIEGTIDSVMGLPKELTQKLIDEVL